MRTCIWDGTCVAAAHPTYRQPPCLQTYDVKDLLRAEGNTLAITVTDGWYAGEGLPGRGRGRGRGRGTAAAHRTGQSPARVVEGAQVPASALDASVRMHVVSTAQSYVTRTTSPHTAARPRCVCACACAGYIGWKGQRNHYGSARRVLARLQASPTPPPHPHPPQLEACRGFSRQLVQVMQGV